ASGGRKSSTALPLPRKRRKEGLHRTTPSPACGGGLGWGPPVAMHPAAPRRFATLPPRAFLCPSVSPTRSSPPASTAATPVATHVMAGVITDARGRVLLARRAPGRELAGLWEFPGGKVDPGETPDAALARDRKGVVYAK